jgi:hypothetical protein
MKIITSLLIIQTDEVLHGGHHFPVLGLVSVAVQF